MSFLERCGISLGNRLYPPNPGNPRGYFEDERLIALHNQILEREGYDYLLKSLDFSVRPDKTDVTRAREIIRDLHLHSETETVAIKDPRISLFLEMWDEVLQHRGKYVFLIRHPKKVTYSLLRRNDPILEWYPHAALTSWYVYNRHIEDFCRKEPGRSIVIDISDFTSSPSKYIDLLRKRYGLHLSEEAFYKVYHNKDLNRKGGMVPKIKTALVRYTAPVLYRKSLQLYRRLPVKSSV